jgi:beta-lactamase regulating signal transducer with metallopeptidase domain
MPMIDAIISWLAATTVRGSILVVGVVVLQFAFRRWMPARWRQALWVPAVVALSWPFLPTCSWSLERHFQKSTPMSEWCCPAPSFDWGDSADAAVGSASRSAQIGWAIIAGCWLAGATWFLGVVWWSYQRRLRGFRENAVGVSPTVENLFRHAAVAVGLRRAPEILVTRAISNPAVTGVFRPTLLLPADFPGVLDEKEAQLVLHHELLHIRRHDLWAGALLCVLQAAHWFNPVAWFAFNRMRFACEQACDEEVLALGGEDDRAPYGHALIKLGSAMNTAEVQLGILSVVSSADDLRTRIRAVADRRRFPPTLAFVWMGIIGVVTLLGATRAPQGVTGDPSHLVGQPLCGVDRARRIILPDVAIADASLAEAMEYLEARSRVSDPSGVGVRILLSDEGVQKARTARISLNLHQVPVWQAFAAVADQANLGADGNAYLLCVKGMFTSQTWEMDERAVEKLELTNGLDARDSLGKRGVAFPPGASVRIVPAVENGALTGRHRLSVRNSRESLQHIDALVKSVSSEPTGGRR